MNKIVEPKLSNTQHEFRSNRSVQTNLLNESAYAHKSIARGHQMDMFLVISRMRLTIFGYAEWSRKSHRTGNGCVIS